MRKIVLLGASALIMALGLASASAEQYNPTSHRTGYDHSRGNANLQEFHESGTAR